MNKLKHIPQSMRAIAPRRTILPKAMRLSLFLLVSTLAYGQPPDPAYQALSKAYQYLQDKQYDEAIDFFLKGIEAAPDRPTIRKDLAYAYLKVGEPEAARDQFAAAMRLDSTDF